MAATCPVGFDVDRLRREVRAVYGRVVGDPGGDFHFNRGLDFACEVLGYDRKELEGLPGECTAPFAGMANPLKIGPIEPGETVLDIGCGAGMDLLLAARRTGPGGRAVGVDMTPEMRTRALEAAAKAGLGEIVEVRDGLAEDLPVEDGSVDVAISNGVINLTPDKGKAFGEIFRVLRPGGRLYLGDVGVRREVSAKSRSDIDLWVA